MDMRTFLSGKLGELKRIEELEQKYRTPLFKKTDESIEQRLLRHRTLSTALSIRCKLESVPFEDLTLSLYFFSKDKSMNDLVREYQKEIELAKGNFDRFCKGLYQFYNRMASKIKKGALYPEFFELFVSCGSYRIKTEGENKRNPVLEAYIELLAQNLEFLRPNKFDMKNIIAGIETNGTLILIKDPLPMLDAVQIELWEKAYRGGNSNDLGLEDLTRVFAKYGYKYISPQDLVMLCGANDAFMYNVNYLIAYINEYTSDIIPETPILHTKAFVTRSTTIDVDSLKDQLTRRRRTLPANGVLWKITGLDNVERILMKEVNHRDSICLLFKVTTSSGEFSGVYNTRDKYYFNYFSWSNVPEIGEYFKQLTLWLYTSLVCDNPNIRPEDFHKVFAQENLPVSATCFYNGNSKLESVARDKASDYERRPLDKTKYTYGILSIQGYIRKLPVGQVASEKAKQLSASLGYELGDDETYVQPFTRRSIKLLPIDD